jgi:O-methyltransferase
MDTRPAGPPPRRWNRLRRLLPRRLHPLARWLRKSLGVRPAEEPWRSVHAYTLVHPERQRHLVQLARRVVRDGVEGDLVECGVLDGGTAALLGHATAGARPPRLLHLFDSWEGLPAPSAEDGEGAAAWAGSVVGSPRRVARVLRLLGVDPARVRVHRGWFADTFAAAGVERVALLHLDADFHDSVLLALEHWWPRLSPGGVVQVDDYDDLPGCRVAVDAFVARHGDATLRAAGEQVPVRWLLKRGAGRAPAPGPAR